MDSTQIEFLSHHINQCSYFEKPISVRIIRVVLRTLIVWKCKNLYNS